MNVSCLKQIPKAHAHASPDLMGLSVSPVVLCCWGWWSCCRPRLIHIQFSQPTIVEPDRRARIVAGLIRGFTCLASSRKY